MAAAPNSSDELVHEELLQGFDQGVGSHAYLGFIELILMSRGISSKGRLFDPSNPEEQANLCFVEDLQEVFEQESVYGIAVVVGSSFITGKESFILEAELHRKVPDSGRQLLGATLVQSLSTLDLPAHSQGMGVHVLLRVSRITKHKFSADGFAVVDEDLDLFGTRQRVYIWRMVQRSRSMCNDNDQFCWLLWTRDRLKV